MGEPIGFRTAVRTSRRALSPPSGQSFAKLLLFLLLSGALLGAVSPASSTSAPGLTLVAGSDRQCGYQPVYPCATVSIGNSGTSATLGISFSASDVSNPQPATYYTDLLEVHNQGTEYRITDSISISGITGAQYLGSIMVYYCTAQTNDPANSVSCAKFDIVTSTGGYLTGNDVLPGSIGPGGIGYLEFVAYASATASSGDTVTFSVTMAQSSAAGPGHAPTIIFTGTSSSGSASADGVTVSFSGATCYLPTCAVSIAVYSGDPEVAAPPLVSAIYFDVSMIGYTGTGTAIVSVTDPSIGPVSSFYYWTGSYWARAASTFLSPHTMSATFPISALLGTAIAIGNTAGGGGGGGGGTTTTSSTTSTSTSVQTVSSSTRPTSSTTQTTSQSSTTVITSSTSSTAASSSSSTAMGSASTVIVHTSTATSSTGSSATTSGSSFPPTYLEVVGASMVAIGVLALGLWIATRRSRPPRVSAGEPSAS